MPCVVDVESEGSMLQFGFQACEKLHRLSDVFLQV